jgi:hypothetical protein
MPSFAKIALALEALSFEKAQRPGVFRIGVRFQTM